MKAWLGFPGVPGVKSGDEELHCTICDLPITKETDKLFSRDPGNHPGILGDVHPECYDQACEERPELPWEDPISGDVAYEEMAEDLGVEF